MIGRQLGQYRVLEKLGEGGMGVVYLAEDTRLGRRVALKVLHAAVSSDPSRRARFEREARAVAALNHPNIVTLHTVEEVEGVTFLTMELVQGSRLSHLLSTTGLPLGRLLDWSLAIADALVAAHRAGVVHRDLKPDNIMVSADGRLKVLDFGLAKLRDTPAPLEGAGTALPTASVTEEGKILGTVSYMSPEQAEGKPLDHRSDIFSFGVVLYEMATGRRPFHGDTAISTISSILKDTPTPPHQVNAALPEEFGRIVRRCLAKQPDRRYQSTDDLRNELRELKEDSESGELSLERRVAPGTGATSAGAAGTTGAPSAATLSGVTPAPGATSRKHPALLLGGAAVVLALAAGAWWAFRPRSDTGSAPESGVPATLQMSRATTDGKVAEAAISPDGRYIAYVRREGSIYSLRLRQLVTGDEVQVVAPSEAFLASPSFSSDGDFLHYVSIEPGRNAGWVNRVSVLGGAPRRIIDGAYGVTASPDGSRIAIIGGPIEQSYVRVAGADGDGPRDLALRKGPDHFDSSARWSSDGRTLAVVSHRFGEPQQAVLIAADTGEERPLTIPTLRTLNDLGWIPGRSALLVTGSERPANMGSAQVWEVTTEGVLRPLTRDLNAYSGLSLTADGSTVATVQVESRTGIEVAPVKGGMPGEFTELFPISASRPGFDGIAWLGSDRIVHGMMQGDIQQISVTDVGSKASRALTTGPPHTSPAVSRDGRVLVVMRGDGDRFNLWRLDTETGRGQRLTEGQYDGAQILSPDGAWLLYSTAGETINLMKMPAAGGAAVELANRPMWCADLTEDGQEALCWVIQPSGDPQAVTMPASGGEPHPIAGIPPGARSIHFSPDGRGITYLTSHEGADEIWNLPRAGGEPRRLARFEGKEIADLAWSPDGTRLAIVKITRSGDVVLLKRTL